MADSTLAAIQKKVRRITRSPSEAQLSDADLNEYINTFLVYDFPEHLRTFNLRQQFSFVCNPYQDLYITDTTLPLANQLYNFQNIYLSVHDPVFIAGYQSFYTQSREQLFGIYPKLQSFQQLFTLGDGVTFTFTGVINSQQSLIPPNFNQHITLLQGHCLFDSLDSNSNGLAMIDVPVQNPDTGFNTVNGNLYLPGLQPTLRPTVIDPTNTINYITGKYTVTFKNTSLTDVAPGPGQIINTQTVPTITSRPQALMYYQDHFIIRPVPDQPYTINFEVFVRPSQLLATGQSPQLEEWWQLISYGAAKKVLEDRMDIDSVALIMPEFQKQMALCERRNLVQWTNERTATIYTEQSTLGWGSGPGGFGPF